MQALGLHNSIKCFWVTESNNTQDSDYHENDKNSIA